MDVSSRSVRRYVNLGVVCGYLQAPVQISVQFRYLQLTCYIGLKWSLSYEISQHPLPYLPFLCLQVNQDISNGIKHLLLWNWILSLSSFWHSKFPLLTFLTATVTKFCPHKHGHERSKYLLNLTFSYQ